MVGMADLVLGDVLMVNALQGELSGRVGVLG